MVSTNNGGGLSAADVAAVMGNGNNGWGLANASTDHERQVVDKWIAKMRSDNT